MTWLIELGQTQQFPLIPVVGQDSFTGAVEQARDLNINNFNLLDDEDKNRKTKLSYIPSLLPHKVSNITHSMREVTVSDHEDSTTAAPLHAREPMINKEASEAQPRKQSDILHKVVVDNLHPKCTLEDLAVVRSALHSHISSLRLLRSCSLYCRLCPNSSTLNQLSMKRSQASLNPTQLLSRYPWRALSREKLW